MPLCDGRPDGPCPSRRNDSSVRHSQGDLMLCPSCDEYRFPPVNKVISSAVTVGTVAAAAATICDYPSTAAGDKHESDLSPVGAVDKRAVLINEVLCFLSNKFYNHPITVIKKAIMDFCREDELFAAKQMLMQFVSDKRIQQYTRKRIGENKNKTTLDDIVNIWSFADENDLINKLPTFCVADLSRVPVLSDELTDISLIRKTVLELEAQVRALSESMKTINLHGQASTAHSAQPQNRSGKPILANDESAHVATPNRSCVSVTLDDANSHGSVYEITAHPDGQVSSELGCTVKNYADVAKRASEDADGQGFQFVPGRKKKQKLVVGNGSSANPLQGVSRKRVFCVNRLKPDTSVDMVKQHLATQNIHVSSCFVVQTGRRQSSNGDSDVSDHEPRFTSFTTMRLCVLQHDAAKVLEPNVWPVGVTVRPWAFKSGQHQGNR